MEYIDPIFAGKPFSRESYNEFCEVIDSPRFMRTDDPQTLCLRRQIRALSKNCTNYLESNGEVKLNINGDVEDDIIYYNSQVHKYVNGIGISVKKPNIYFVDLYPKPYESRTFLAMSMDESDERTFGIPVGLYFRRDMLRPSYSLMLLFHEWVHVIFSRSGEQYLGGALEEGLSELYGCLYLTYKFLGQDSAETLFIYHRLFSKSVKSLDLYLEYARAALMLYEMVGFKGIHHLMSLNRHELKKLEQRIWQRNFFTKDIPTGEWNSQFTDLARRCLLLYGKHSVCSPLAYTVAQHVSLGQTVSQIAEAATLPEAAIREALVELSSAPRLLQMDNNKVVYSDCERIVHQMQLRFTVPQDVEKYK